MPLDPGKKLMNSFLIQLAFLNVFRKKIRASLTIGGIAISVSVMVFMFGLGAGLQAMVTEQISKAALRNVITVSTKNTRQLPIDHEALALLQSISGVSFVETVTNVSGQITLNGKSQVLPLYAVSSKYFEVSPVKTVAGEVNNQLAPNSTNIILSTGALKAFGIKDNRIGETLPVTVNINKDSDPSQEESSRKVTTQQFTIKGIIERGASPIGYIPAGFLEKNGLKNYSEAKVQVTFPEKTTSIRESIEQLGLQTANIQDAIGQVDRIFKVIRSILVAFGLITILITIFGTINTITIQLVEETKQIGFLRIMGIKKEHVGQLFIMQSVILSMVGVSIGIVCGVILGVISNGVITASTVGNITNENTSVYLIPVFPIIIMLALAILLGWVIGLMPARRAIKINPLEAVKS